MADDATKYAPVAPYLMVDDGWEPSPSTSKPSARRNATGMNTKAESGTSA